MPAQHYANLKSECTIWKCSALACGGVVLVFAGLQFAGVIDGSHISIQRATAGTWEVDLKVSLSSLTPAAFLFFFAHSVRLYRNARSMMNVLGSVEYLTDPAKKDELLLRGIESVDLREPAPLSVKNLLKWHPKA